MTAYPAISLWQPWASLILVGAKRFETRHWHCGPSRIGARVAIHAAKRLPAGQEVLELQRFTQRIPGWKWSTLPFGAVICTATLRSCHRVLALDSNGMVHLDDKRVFSDDHFGDYTPGRFVWELRDVEPVEPPVPARGRQAWFAVDIEDRRPTARKGLTA